MEGIGSAGATIVGSAQESSGELASCIGGRARQLSAALHAERAGADRAAPRQGTVAPSAVCGSPPAKPTGLANRTSAERRRPEPGGDVRTGGRGIAGLEVLADCQFGAPALARNTAAGRTPSRCRDS